MKVLLFVQNGDARPKCLQGVHGDVMARAKPRYHYEPCPGWMFTAIQVIEMKAADHWWLVECMSAAHGRDIIRHVEKYGEDAVQSPLGRIIASSNGRGESCPSNVVSE